MLDALPNDEGLHAPMTSLLYIMYLDQPDAGAVVRPCQNGCEGSWRKRFFESLSGASPRLPQRLSQESFKGVGFCVIGKQINRKTCSVDSAAVFEHESISRIEKLLVIGAVECAAVDAHCI